MYSFFPFQSFTHLNINNVLKITTGGKAIIKDNKPNHANGINLKTIF